MKRTLITVAMALLATNAMAANVNYDKFTNQTTVKAMEPIVSGRYLLDVVVMFKGKVPSKASPPVAMVFWIGPSPDWKYLTCHATHFLADDKPVAIEKNDFDGSVHTGFVLEQIENLMTYTSVKQMADAAKVEMEVCNDQITFSDVEMATLHDVVNTVEGLRKQ